MGRLAVALFLLSAVAGQAGCATTPGGGVIVISYALWGRNTIWRIYPDDQLSLSVTNDHPMATDTAHSEERFAVGKGGYNKIAELVASTRQWTGGAMPCDRSIEETLIPDRQGGPTAILRWEGSGESVTIPLTCVAGPSQEDLAKVKKALDLMKGWASAAPLPNGDAQGQRPIERK